LCLSQEGVEQSQQSSDLLVRYGTTLIVAMAVRNTLLVGQIGDGEVILVRSDGTVVLPLVCETAEVGVVTDSLCSPESHLRWRTANLDVSKGGIVLLCTDGMVNAFSDENQLNAFARSLQDRIQEFGWEQVASSLPRWLDHYSARGSGDDITLAVLMIHPAVKEQTEMRSCADATSPLANEESQGKDHVIGNRTTGIRGDIQNTLSSEETTG
jgi:serine/threonine protein phosphatase PrpC